MGLQFDDFSHRVALRPIERLEELLAYALFVDTGTRAQRWCSLTPGVLVGVLWAAAYVLLGHGASGSGLYVDHVGEPLRFARAVGERAPLLLWGQWAFPGADLQAVLSERGGLLIFVGLGSMGLLAQYLAWLRAPEAWSRLRHRVVFVALLVVHVVLAPLGALGGFQQLSSFNGCITRWRTPCPRTKRCDSSVWSS